MNSMRKKISYIVIGAVLILLGVCYIGDIMGVWNFNLFFKGWWTMFIILPCVMAIIEGGIKTGPVIGIIIGVLLLLAANNYFTIEMLFKLAIPLLLIVIGIAVVVSVFKEKKVNQNGNPGYIDADYKPVNDGTAPNASGAQNSTGSTDNANGTAGYEANSNFNSTAYAGASDIAEINAILCENNKNFNNMVFKGANMCAILGGAGLDLRMAIIPQNCVITVTSVLGGAEIRFPPNVNVVVNSTPILGGIDNKTTASTYLNAPTVEIRATTILGGIELK